MIRTRLLRMPDTTITTITPRSDRAAARSHAAASGTRNRPVRPARRVVFAFPHIHMPTSSVSVLYHRLRISCTSFAAMSEALLTFSSAILATSAVLNSSFFAALLSEAAFCSAAMISSMIMGGVVPFFKARCLAASCLDKISNFLPAASKAALSFGVAVVSARSLASLTRGKTFPMLIVDLSSGVAYATNLALSSAPKARPTSACASASLPSASTDGRQIADSVFASLFSSGPHFVSTESSLNLSDRDGLESCG